MPFKELQFIYTYRHKYLSAVKYKSQKAVAHVQRAPQLLDLSFNYAQILIAFLLHLCD